MAGDVVPIEALGVSLHERFGEGLIEGDVPPIEALGVSLDERFGEGLMGGDVDPIEAVDPVTFVVMGAPLLVVPREDVFFFLGHCFCCSINSTTSLTSL